MNENETAQSERAFRRGAHHATAAIYRKLLSGQQQGLSVDALIESIGKLEDEIAQWRNQPQVELETPPWEQSQPQP